MNTIDSKVVVDHVSDLCPVKKPNPLFFFGSDLTSHHARGGADNLMGTAQKSRIPISLVCFFFCAFSIVFTLGDNDISCETLLLELVL